MTIEIGLLLGIVVIAMAAFAFEWLPVDVVGLAILLSLVLTGLVSPTGAFSGFGSEAVVLIFSLLIMTAALTRSGAVDLVTRGLLRRTGLSARGMFVAIVVSVSALSAFISNTAAAAFFVPVAIGLAGKAGVSPSRFLMPVAFAAILSSSVTLISTSTNVIVSGLMTNLGLEGLGMFELSAVGIPVLLVGLAYLYLLPDGWIPERAGTKGMVEEFGIRSYVTEVLILPTSPLVGKTLATSAWGHELDLTVLRIIREHSPHLLPEPDTVLCAGDVLLVEGPRAEVLKVKDTAGIEIKPDVELSDPNLSSQDLALVEALVGPGSHLVGHTLRGLRFRERRGLQVLGINREGRNLLRKLSRLALRVGDVLLVQGTKARLAAVEEQRAFTILNAVEEKRPERSRAGLAAGIFGGAVLLAATNLVPISVAMLLGAFMTFLTRCITPADAYREVEWRLIILVGCMLGLGTAMSSTGAAEFLASQLVHAGAGWNPFWLVGGFFLLTVGLTQIMSNQGAAVVLLPTAINTATQLDCDPRPFAVAISVAASCSFMTPLEPACLLVYGPGRYRFADFLKVGTPLTLLLLVTAMLVIPRFWPVRPPG